MFGDVFISFFWSSISESRAILAPEWYIATNGFKTTAGKAGKKSPADRKMPAAVPVGSLVRDSRSALRGRRALQVQEEKQARRALQGPEEKQVRQALRVREEKQALQGPEARREVCLRKPCQRTPCLPRRGRQIRG